MTSTHIQWRFPNVPQMPVRLGPINHLGSGSFLKFEIRKPPVRLGPKLQTNRNPKSQIKVVKSCNSNIRFLKLFRISEFELRISVSSLVTISPFLHRNRSGPECTRCHCDLRFPSPFFAASNRGVTRSRQPSFEMNPFQTNKSPSFSRRPFSKHHSRISSSVPPCFTRSIKSR